MNGEYQGHDGGAAAGAGPAPEKKSSRDSLVGQTLDGRFYIEEVLGTGGMSVVYKARQLRVDRYVAIKTIRMQMDIKPVYRERFQREISSLCALSHPNIVTVYDCFFGEDDQPYVVMDYLRGRSLELLIEQDGPIDVERFARISVQVCSALDHAHKKGIIHRDLKPGNIVLMDDEMDFVKVVDFGLAKLSQDNRKLTQSGELWGSPPYMSPEQCMGSSGDERSDLYSFGAVMYEMLTGKDPYWQANTIFELIQNHTSSVPPQMVQANPSSIVPHQIEEVVFRCMDREPDNRYQSAQELQDAIISACAQAGQKSEGLLFHPSTQTRSRPASPETTSEQPAGGVDLSSSGLGALLDGPPAPGGGSSPSGDSSQSQWFAGAMNAGNASLEQTVAPQQEGNRWARGYGGADTPTAGPTAAGHEGGPTQDFSGGQGVRDASRAAAGDAMQGRGAVGHSGERTDEFGSAPAPSGRPRSPRLRGGGELDQPGLEPPSSKSWLPAAVVVVALLIVICGAGFYFMQSSKTGGPTRQAAAPAPAGGSPQKAASSSVEPESPAGSDATTTSESSEPAVAASKRSAHKSTEHKTASGGRKAASSHSSHSSGKSHHTQKAHTRHSSRPHPAPAKAAASHPAPVHKSSGKADPWSKLQGMYDK